MQSSDGGGDTLGKNAGTLLGGLLVDRGKIKESDVDRIVQFARKKRLRFGEAATRLRLISKLDLEHAIATQFDYPYLDKGAGGYSDKLIAAFSPFSSKGQALRNLRTQLLLRWPSDAHQTLAVVAPGNKEASGLIAANLAIVFSQLGQRTLIVDSDLQQAHQHQLFKVKNNVGLSALLVGRASLASVIKELSLFRDLSILPAGAPPPNPAELLGRKALHDIIRELRRVYDVLVFDAPPFNANCGAEAVAVASGNALVVLRKNRTYLTDAAMLMQALRGTGTEVVGAVMANKF
jgi:protein-tyrosine kinase